MAAREPNNDTRGTDRGNHPTGSGRSSPRSSNDPVGGVDGVRAGDVFVRYPSACVLT